MEQEIKKLSESAKKYAKHLDAVLAEMRKVIVGQDDVLEKLMMGLIADGHILIEGVPGLAKTLMIKTLAQAIKVGYQRIQFTPDLLPADIIGTRIFNMKANSFSTKKGPIFSNLILADEINRAPPKCQSALLEAMQERQVTIGEDTFLLDRPFLVLATMNPIETEGTYKLPEAQVDRFMAKLLIKYPSKDQEVEIIRRNTRGHEAKVASVITADEILRIQRFVKDIYADEKIESYVASIVDATRHPKEHDLDIDGHIDYGASPRASIWLIMGAKATALLQGRGYVTPEDVQEVAYDVLRHRILLSYEAEAEEVSPDDIIKKILEKVKVP